MRGAAQVEQAQRHQRGDGIDLRVGSLRRLWRCDLPRPSQVNTPAAVAATATPAEE